MAEGERLCGRFSSIDKPLLSHTEAIPLSGHRQGSLCPWRAAGPQFVFLVKPLLPGRRAGAWRVSAESRFW